MTFQNFVVFELSYLTETGEKLPRVRLENTYAEFFQGLCNETFLTLSAKPALGAIFNTIKKSIRFLIRKHLIR